MKKNLSVIAILLICSIASSQVPQGFNYQSVARNAIGNPIGNTNLQVKIGITSDAAGNIFVWEEQHSVTTNDMGLFTLVVGSPSATRIQGSALTFAAINWASSPLYIKTTLQYQGTWSVMGTAQLWSVPYSMLSSKSVDFAGTFTFDGDTVVIMKPVSIGSDDAGRALLAVTSIDDSSGDPLFEVKRKDGQTVFAVYNDAVNIYVPAGTGKASKGGFAIGSFDASKGGASQDYFRVTPDSVRIYINDNPSFTKAPSSKGGFAIGSFDSSKGIKNTYFNLTAASSVDTVGSRAQILWYPKKEAFLAGRVHIGSADSVGQNSTALGYHSIAMGNWSQAFGFKAKATGSYSTAIGNNSKAEGSDSYALGSGAEATGLRSFALGSVGVDASGNPTSRKTVASGPYSVAIGMGAQATTQSAAMALGTNSTASGFASTSIGYGSEANNHYAVAIGYYSKATQYYAHAFGLLSEATGQGSLALGMYSKASGSYSSTMGYYAEANKPYSVALGYYAKAYGDYSGAFGRSAQATGNNSVAVGYGVLAGGLDASAFGKSATASGQGSLSMGVSTVASGLNSVSIGYSSDAINQYSVAIGYDAQSSGQYSMSAGYQANASANYSTALGVNAASSGSYSTSMGYGASSVGSYSIALGMSSTSTANYATSLGYSSDATAPYSTAIGYNASASGDKSISIGAYYSYTFFRFVKGGGFTPITINRQNTAADPYSIAIGNGNTVSGGGLALGSNNYSKSTSAVAIGHTNYADSAYSFAAGYGSRASGYYAFAMGEAATAQASNSFVVGTYNLIAGDKVEWIETDPLFVIGNGTSSVRSNAMTVTKSGRVGLQTITAPSYALQLPNSILNGEGRGLAYFWATYSDGRVKTDNKALPYGLNEIMSLKPQVYFHHNSESNGDKIIIGSSGIRDIGLIAQEVYSIIPEAVVKPADEEKDLWSMSYEKLVPVLIKGMQEQQTIIEAQQREIEELKALFESLKATVQSIGNK
jgi:trimeric autotransporter adhesin